MLYWVAEIAALPSFHSDGSDQPMRTLAEDREEAAQRQHFETEVAQNLPEEAFTRNTVLWPSESDPPRPVTQRQVRGQPQRILRVCTGRFGVPRDSRHKQLGTVRIPRE